MIFIKIKYLKYIFIYFVKIMVTKIYSTAPLNILFIMSEQYVYLIQEREFIKTSENIFKVGKYKQENNKRINQYPKQSKLILQILCDNCDEL